ncbi:MAG TPA: response regulator transcription factor [Saprospiraceae bacterium]|nr:response regulator transcription factor [Saprospiraceae bacterium]
MKHPAILFIEDEPKVATSLQKGLEENGFEVDLAPDGAVGRHMATQKAYDLILLDINLPFVNGYEVCRSIRATNTEVPVIMLTARGSMDEKISGFDAGADDYLVKPVDFRELLARIRVFLKRRSAGGGDLNESNVLRIADLELNSSTQTVSRQGMPVNLTAKEFALLEFLIRCNGRVVTRAEITEKVWDVNFDTGTNVVDVYINFLRKKIDRNFEPKLIHTKQGVGYFLKPL